MAKKKKGKKGKKGKAKQTCDTTASPPATTPCRPCCPWRPCNPCNPCDPCSAFCPPSSCGRCCGIPQCVQPDRCYKPKPPRLTYLRYFADTPCDPYDPGCPVNCCEKSYIDRKLETCWPCCGNPACPRWAPRPVAEPVSVPNTPVVPTESKKKAKKKKGKKKK